MTNIAPPPGPASSGRSTPSAADPLQRACTMLASRLLAGQSALAQLFFDATVLDHYRGRSGAKVVRTNTVGRLTLPGWSLDFGIAEPGPDHGTALDATQGTDGTDGTDSKTAGGRTLIHCSLVDAQTRLPEGERAHWATHAVLPPSSLNFLLMQLTRGACLDDGDLRTW